MLLGFALMLACFIALDRITQMSMAIPLLALASAGWTLPTAAAYPLFIEQIPRHARGVLASLFLLCMALGGAIGDPLNGRLFDLFDSYRPLFMHMSVYTVLAVAADAGDPARRRRSGAKPIRREPGDDPVRQLTVRFATSEWRRRHAARHDHS